MRELEAAAGAAATSAADGERADDEEVGLDRVLGLQALAEVAARLLEAVGEAVVPASQPAAAV